jgi:hypothetical protein
MFGATLLLLSFTEDSLQVKMAQSRDRDDARSQRIRDFYTRHSLLLPLAWLPHPTSMSKCYTKILILNEETCPIAQYVMHFATNEPSSNAKR